MSKPILDNSHPIMRTILYIEWVGLLIITILIIIAIGQELLYLIEQKKVALHDILLLFIYLEVLTMVALYYTSGKLPVRYPIYIAIVAVTRYIILNMKEMQPIELIYLCLAILILTLSVIVLRLCQSKFPFSQVD